MNDGSLFIAITAMAGVTAFSRVLPFLLSPRSRLLKLLSGDHPAIRIAGPALLVALAVASVARPVLESPSRQTLLSYGVGALATAAVLRWRHSVGLAVVAGIVAFGLAGPATSWLMS